MDNRQQLLDSALHLFSMRGYDAVGVQEIVVSVGLTKPSLYHYFGSKRGLLEALLKEKSAPFLEELETASAYRGDLSRTLEAVLDAYLDFAESVPDFLRFVLSLLFCPPDHEAHAPAIALFSAQRDKIEAMFFAAAEDHGNMRGRHVRYAYIFIGLINSVVAAHISADGPIDTAQRRDILHQFSHGIYS